MRWIKIIIFVLYSCSSSSKPSQTPLEYVKEKRDFYVAHIENPYDLIQRCDGLTFLGIWDGSVQEEHRVDIYDHRDELGRWHRDVRPCFPNDSRSEISTEGILGAVRSMAARGDRDGIRDLCEYGRDNHWIMGEGPEEYTDLWFLELLICDHASLSLVKTDDEDAVSEHLAGYRGNVLLDYIELDWTLRGYIPAWQKKMLSMLVDQVPTSPLYQAMHHCFTDGDQTVAVGILMDDEIFPIDRVPVGASEIFDWSDAPSAILYIWAVSILEKC